MTNKSFLQSFPQSRLRRNRQSAWVRDLVAENSLKASDLIMPFFVIEGEDKKEGINGLPDQFRFSIDLLIKQVQKCHNLGIKAIMLFPAIAPELKNDNGKEALNTKNLICRTVKAIKESVPQIGVICDVALDPYTAHGHDGVLNKTKTDVANDKTVEILCKQALILAKAGADAVAPSDMMDGRVGRIRQYLDKNGFENVNIMAYSAKYASSFYGPFRNAVGSKVGSKIGSKIDKKTYQMSFENAHEALREIEQDINEGADMVIVKPGLPYLDVTAKAKQKFNFPLASYHVSGEYAMLKLAAKEGLLDFDKALFESLICFKRAGADAIITYGAMEVAKFFS
jgi:porphobilinogen synthase